MADEHEPKARIDAETTQGQVTPEGRARMEALQRHVVAMADGVQPLTIEERLAALEEQLIAMREVLKIITTYGTTNGTPPASAIAQVRAFFAEREEG